MGIVAAGWDRMTIFGVEREREEQCTRHTINANPVATSRVEVYSC